MKYVLISLCFFSQLLCNNLIERCTIKKNRLDITVNKEFKQAYLTDDFFVEYDMSLEKLPYSIVTLPFVMNVISLVWISRKNYYIKEMDQEIYDSLMRIKEMFTLFYPKTAWTGELIPRKLVTNRFPTSKSSNKTALLFSGGLDSIASSFAHRDKQQLLITAWGQFGLPLHQPSLWHKVKNRLEEHATRYGHENTYLKSNYYDFLNFKKINNLSDEIYTWRIDTIEDIGWAGLTAPILATRGIKTLRIASSDVWDFPYPSAANPYIDGNITFAGIKIKHDQFDYTRYDKLAFIKNLCTHHLVEKPQLIICQTRQEKLNCATCEKCCITLLALIALDMDLEDYGYTLSVKKALKKH